MAIHTFDPHGDDDLSLPSDKPDEPAKTSGGAAASAADVNLASDLIRDKLDRIYAEEPEATQELAEAAANSKGRSKHQQFMYELGTSGKDLATIQTEWHHYYENLPDKEKHVVWQEFYASQSTLTRPAAVSPSQTLAKNRQPHGGRPAKPAPKLRDARNTKEVQQAIRHSVTGGGKLEAKHHLQSLLFGLGLGAIVIIIFLFGFFNEVVISPFIQPGRANAATPLIVSNNGVAPTPDPQVIIPKINVQIPVNYDQTSTNEADIENSLEDGVVHYPTTVLPGQNGNAAFFGHSSNNIFNKGKYKFAFVLLHTLVPGDTFYLTYNNKLYVYKVVSRKIVDPSEVGVLGPVPGQTATATLITCDPPGTSLHRLIVVGEQISPDPGGNTKATNQNAGAGAATVLPANGPTLWGRFISTGVGKGIVVLAILGVAIWTFRRLNDRLVIK